ncbi:meiotic cell cortex C-terminal pleckstrin homology-domain-containing protein [Thamnidium elegans]|nr:meiotic cell cortex C-terminal pleckstrin homology-domain-containing protein [Thamnidium elegans]
MMFEQNSSTITVIDQRRKSSPECFFPFKAATSTSNFLLQKQKDDNKDQETSNWIRSRKQSFKEVFHHNSINKSPVHHNNNKTVIIPSPPSPFLLENTSTRFLRSNSDTRYSPPFSSISSSNSSYFSSSSYANSITLPAAPVLSGSTFSSIKKKKKRQLLRASITGSPDLFFKPLPSNQDKRMMMISSNDTPSHNNATSDIELATEIGQGLLSEVRRMQSILQERQDSLLSLESERADNQQRIDDLLKQLRYKNETEERLKEDIWNLELTKQDLSHQIRQLSQTIAKTQLEQAKRERQSSLVHQELELLKAAQLNWQEDMHKTQIEYEATLSALNVQLTKLKLEKDAIGSELQQLAKMQHEAREVEQEDENRLRRVSEQEIKALQVSLGQAHTVVENLQLDLEKEKQKKIEVDALLRESQETIESMQKSSSASDTWCQDVKSSLITLKQVSDTESASLEYEMDSAIVPKEQFGSIIIQNSFTNNVSSLKERTKPESKPIHPLVPNEFEKSLPFVMHTMIGEWVLKYTRNRIGHGISNKSHRRFFWLHPYNKTLYWSQQEPGVKGGEYKAKSVCIESFLVDQKQHGTKPVIVIKSSVRDIRLQCITKDSHEKWIQSLKDLLKDEPALPQPRRLKTLQAKDKRLSLLLETAPPSTVRQKKMWRMSEANLDFSAGSHK